VVINHVDDFTRINNITERGATFCQDVKISAEDHEMADITDGYHM
jgi:hypothetical protein